jgi:mono/diheme cytochrome c family protein
MNETLFFVLGSSLVVAAIVVAAIGLRSESFPGSKALLIGATTLFATLVVATGAFAWLNAEDEQDHREAELADSAAQSAASGDEGEAAEEVGSEVENEASPVASVDGAAVFDSAGCSGCHTLAAAGSTATTGPDLDQALKGKDEAFIETSIADPNAAIAEGYPPDLMPQTFGDDLSSEELGALVQYLSASANG